MKVVGWVLVRLCGGDSCSGESRPLYVGRSDGKTVGVCACLGGLELSSMHVGGYTESPSLSSGRIAIMAKYNFNTNAKKYFTVTNSAYAFSQLDLCTHIPGDVRDDKIFFGVASPPVLIHYDGLNFYSRILEKDGGSANIKIQGITLDDVMDVLIAGELNSVAFVSRLGWSNPPSLIIERDTWLFSPTYNSNLLQLDRVESIAFSPI